VARRRKRLTKPGLEATALEAFFMAGAGKCRVELGLAPGACGESLVPLELFEDNWVGARAVELLKGRLNRTAPPQEEQQQQQQQQRVVPATRPATNTPSERGELLQQEAGEYREQNESPQEERPQQQPAPMRPQPWFMQLNMLGPRELPYPSMVSFLFTYSFIHLFT
jgi:hypothetical protein